MSPAIEAGGVGVPICGKCGKRATHRTPGPVALGGGNFAIVRRCAGCATPGMLQAYAPPKHARPSPTRHLRPLDQSLIP